MTSDPFEQPGVEETIVAYVDGVLAEPARAAFEARLSRDPILAQRVEAHRWLGRQIGEAFGPGPDELAVSPALAELLGLRRPSFAPSRRRPAWRMGWAGPAWAGAGAALAASVAFVLWIGIGGRIANQTVATDRYGKLVASGELAEALASQPSGGKGPITVALTIRTADGPCRTFRADSGMSGLACFRDGKWTLPVVASSPGLAPAGGDYRLASGEVAPAVMAEVDRRIVGDPLTPAEEKTLLDRHWR